MTEYTYTAESLHALDDAAFNRVIAQLDGWTVARDDDNSVPGREQWYWVLHNGVECAYVPAETEAEAWDYALTPDPECGDTALPRYASSLDAAWGLAQWISLHMVREGAHWVVIVHDGVQGGAYRIETPNPARALSTAWLLWKQEQRPSSRED